MLEEIVGNIFDEHDVEDSEVIQSDESTFLINGTLSLHDAEKFLDIEFPTEDYDTLSGYLIGQIGNIPNPHDKQQTIDLMAIYL